jgi:CRISPR type I-E-associated protein CasB/Cse2
MTTSQNKKPKDTRLSTEERNSLIAQFITNLQNAKKKDLVRLQHTKNEVSKDNLRAYQVFHRYLPKKLYYSFDEEIYFLVSILYGIHPLHLANKRFRSFGTTLGSLTPTPERLFSRILTSTFDKVTKYRDGGGELASLLRKGVFLASRENIGIDYTRLCKDLIYWAHPDKFVQKRWVRDFSIQSHQSKSTKK